VYFNTALGVTDNIYVGSGSQSFVCTTPDPGGIGNITADPLVLFMGNPRLILGSPCIGRGETEVGMDSALDIDGELRLNGLPDLGADEFWPDNLNGLLAPAITVAYTNVAVDYPLDFLASCEGKAEGLAWNFGDGTVVTNQSAVIHAFQVPGSYDVVLSVWNRDTYMAVTTRMEVVQGIYHVAQFSSAGRPPFENWDVAASTLQDAVDAAVPGGVVLVSNGVYAVGGRWSDGPWFPVFNRVWVDRPLTLRSVNGPTVTIIDGAVQSRCVKLDEGGRMSGFTLINGSSRISNDGGISVLSGGGVYAPGSSVVSNCVITGCRADLYGGGAYGGRIESCILSNNTVINGYGGGAAGSILRDCRLVGNSAPHGGGARNCTLERCRVFDNYCNNGGGGGVQDSSATSCFIAGNTSTDYGGGAYKSILENCTLMDNVAVYDGGGTYGCTVRNSIVYYNTLSDGSVNNVVSGWGANGWTLATSTCAMPLPAFAENCITNPPGLAGVRNPRLVAGSPCINRGTNQIWMAAATDLNGQPRLAGASVDMGCTEWSVGSQTGVLQVALSVSANPAAPGRPIRFTADIQGVPGGMVWSFGDGACVTNEVIVTHTYATSGVFVVRLSAWNLNPTVVVAAQSVFVSEACYVATNGLSRSPYTSWENAATNIQDAIDAAGPGMNVVVGDGTYESGGGVAYELWSRICIRKSIVVRSKNGPHAAVIRGKGPSAPDAARCAYVGNGGLLSGFTLEGGATRELSYTGYLEGRSGGGAFCESGGTVSNCIISGNTSTFFGAGVRGGVLRNSIVKNNVNSLYLGGGLYNVDAASCLITGNSGSDGGGAAGGVLVNCTVIGNSWGGVYNSQVMNSILLSNTGYNVSGGTVSYSCAPGLTGAGNITNAPSFVDAVNSNYRLAANSPGINAGINQSWMAGALDLEGRPRILGGTVDMGAYESGSLNQAPVITKRSPLVDPAAVNEGVSVAFSVTANDNADTNATTRGMSNVIW
jgi:hypothetical protein